MTESKEKTLQALLIRLLREVPKIQLVIISRFNLDWAGGKQGGSVREVPGNVWEGWITWLKNLGRQVEVSVAGF